MARKRTTGFTANALTTFYLSQDFQFFQPPRIPAFQRSFNVIHCGVLSKGLSFPTTLLCFNFIANGIRVYNFVVQGTTSGLITKTDPPRLSVVKGTLRGFGANPRQIKVITEINQMCFLRLSSTGARASSRECCQTETLVAHLSTT